MRELKNHFLTPDHEALLQRAELRLQRHELKVLQENVPTLSIPKMGVLKQTFFDHFEDKGYQLTPVYSEGKIAYVIQKDGTYTTRATLFFSDRLEAENALIYGLIIDLIREKQEQEMEAEK